MSENLSIFDLLQRMVEMKGSDLHLQAGNVPQVRLWGMLQPLPGVPALRNEHIERLLDPILGERETQSLRSAGTADFGITTPQGQRVRANVYRQRGCLGAAFRHIPGDIPNLAQIGAPIAALKFVEKTYGLVLVTGPTGSGKSTTLAAMIDAINTSRPCHILTLEDPIEFLHRNKKGFVNQREVGRDVADFASGLRSAMRQDPDVILVGEMRDLETTATAITAAETGHLVFSTLHTRSAPATIERIIDQFPSSQQDQIRIQLASSLLGVISQRLLPKADGSGRVAAHEVMVVTPAIENIIRTNKTAQLRGQIQTGAEHDMQTLDKAIAYLAYQGTVDLQEGRRVSQDPEELESLIAAYAAGRAVQVPRFVTHADLPRLLNGDERPLPPPSLRPRGLDSGPPTVGPRGPAAGPSSLRDGAPAGERPGGREANRPIPWHD